MIKMNKISAPRYLFSAKVIKWDQTQAPSCNSNSKIAVELDKMSQELLLEQNWRKAGLDKQGGTPELKGERAHQLRT